MIRNIDNIRRMTIEELADFVTGFSCKCCVYDNDICMHDRCTEGLAAWLRQEAELTPEAIRDEYDEFCQKYVDCTGCKYHTEDEYSECLLLYTMEHFNIENGKITRRKED